MPEDFSESQKVVLKALCNAAFAGHEGTEAQEIMEVLPEQLREPFQTQARIDKFISSSFSDIQDVSNLTATYSAALSSTNVGALAMTLSLLSTRAGTFALTGYTSCFVDLSIKERESVLLGWSTSSLLLLRKAFRGFVSTAMLVAYTSGDQDIPLGIGYPSGDPTRHLDLARLPSSYPYLFESIDTSFQVFETEVLVLGSGVGGGVVASEMTKKGWKTVVVEKGRFVPAQELAGNPAAGLQQLYENEGLMATEEGSVNVLAGSGFGGGSSVNWSASLRTPHYVREDWAKNHGLDHFLSDEFTESMEFICKRMGVSDVHLVHNKPNELFVKGARKLGYHVERIPQNTGGNQHACGFCSFGCPYSEKQSGVVSWLRDAAEGGAKFFIETNVERLLFATSSSAPSPTEATLAQYTPTSSRKHCIGALVKDKDGKLAVIRAKQAVVVSAGSLNSPAILMRSGLTSPRIGQNLHLHPSTYITGYYDQVIRPWEGAIMTALSNACENRDGSHFGVKLEVNMSFPGGTAAAFQKWTGSKEHKKNLLQFNQSFTILAICRDRGSGRIILDKQNKSRMSYNLDPYDGLSLLDGVIGAAKIHLAAGANRIVTSQAGVEDYVPQPGHRFLADPKWLTWIEKVKKAGVFASWSALGSAHQMGSCQMGVSPSKSVVDPRGRVWGHSGLYVADASVFPGASGVNPMITNYATSHSIAQFINQDLVEAGKSAGGQVHL